MASGVGNWTLTGIENLSGDWGSDDFTGDGNANVLAGAGGDDTLVGGGGHDILMGDGALVLGTPFNQNSYQFVAELTAIGFTSPREALAEVDSSRPHALLVDYTLPEMSGDELVRALRERLPSVPIIVMTGNTSEVRRAEASSEIQVLAKPFPMDRLLSMLDRATGGSE